jgi:4-amino-4-deoxy-L-arabinose transferase-like glycosyltransferase
VLSSRDHLSLRAYGFAVWAVVLVGIVLRVAQYLYNRSLWMDESFLALNLIDKPFSALFAQLSFNQAAPPGFLLIQRADITLFGKSEYALRLFPLVCGISSILLFKRVVRALLGRSAALIALALFSLSDGLIYYSSEVKQYSADVAITLLIALGGLDLTSRRPSRRRAIVWGFIGSAAVWFSHAAAFAVAAVVLVLLAADIAQRRWQVAKPVAAVLGVWLANLAVALVYERYTVSHVLHSYTGDNSIGLSAARGSSSSAFPTGIEFFRGAGGGLADSLGIPTTGPAHDTRYLFALIGLVGVVALARRSVRVFALVATPAVGVFVAAALGAYPVLPRTILFLVPLVAVLVSEGVVALVGILRTWRAAATLALAAAVVAVPLATAGGHLVVPRQREEMKPALRYLAGQWQPGDSLYVFYRAQYALRYYLECDCLLSSRIRRRVFAPVVRPRLLGSTQYAPALLSDPPHILIAQEHETLRDYVKTMTPLLRRRRVWVLVTAADPVERSLLDYLSCIGLRDSYVRRNSGEYATVILDRYDLSSWRSLTDGTCGPRFGL